MVLPAAHQFFSFPVDKSLGFRAPATSSRFSGSGGEVGRAPTDWRRGAVLGMASSHPILLSPPPSVERNGPPWRPDQRRCLLLLFIVRESEAQRRTATCPASRTQQTGTGGKPPAPRLIGYSLETWMPWEISPSGDGISVQMSEKEWFHSMSLTMATASP